MAGVAVGAFLDTNGQESGQFHVFTTPQTGTISIPLNFTYGDAFHMTWFLSTYFGTPLDCGPCIDPDAPIDYLEMAGIGSGHSDYFHTMKLTGLLPTDLAGNPILDAQFASDSGTQYDVNGVVPEPASLLLLGSGLAAYAVRRRRRQSAR